MPARKIIPESGRHELALIVMIALAIDPGHRQAAEDLAIISVESGG